MKILHYIPSIDETSGGVGAYMQLLTRDLGALCELHVVTHKSPKERELEGCSLHYISNGWLRLARVRKEWEDILKEIKPDAVHINCCWLPISALTAIWAKRQGFRVIYSPHGMLEPWILNRNYWAKKLPAILLYQRKAIRIADCLHATAESERTNLMALGWNSNIQTIGNCVDVSHIEMKQSWVRQKRILFLSRVHVKKGINFLIEAVAKLREQMEGFEVLIAGPGEEDYIRELQQFAARLGVGDIVRFIGSVYGDAKFDLYRQADLFVLPTHSENFGIVVTEALACGTPVITTKGTPWAELESNHCGWWTGIGTEATVEALKFFLALSEAELEIMGRNGRKLVEEKYSCEIIAQKFMEMYNNC